MGESTPPPARTTPPIPSRPLSGSRGAPPAPPSSMPPTSPPNSRPAKSDVPVEASVRRQLDAAGNLPQSSPDVFSHDARLLSDRIRRVLNQMKAIPGKSEGQIENPSGRLLFTRDGDSWTLMFQPITDEWGPGVLRDWSELSIDEKVSLAMMLPELFREVLDESRRRLDGMRKAHAILSDLETELAREISLMTEGA